MPQPAAAKRADTQATFVGFAKLLVPAPPGRLFPGRPRGSLAADLPIVKVVRAIPGGPCGAAVPSP